MPAATTAVLVTMLCWSSPLLGAKPASHWQKMAHTYEESSLVVFRDLLAALQMEVKELADKSGLPEGRLHRYLRGEVVLDEIELDRIELYVEEVKDIVRKFGEDDSGIATSSARKLLYGAGGKNDLASFREYVNTERVVRELLANKERLTIAQMQLVDKVNEVTNEAFARLEHGVRLSTINYYNKRRPHIADNAGGNARPPGAFRGGTHAA